MKKKQCTKSNLKNGTITTTITLLVSVGFLLVLTIYIINTIIPFIWYQKLQTIANKYVYVIERFGYLTDTEEKAMYQELQADGFDLSCLEVNCPKNYLEYGTLFEFKITYNLHQEYSIILNGIKNEARTVPLTIRKYGYSKI